jgi:hypothetical protein
MSGLGCKIGIGKNNLPTVVNDSGNTPQLFKDLLDYFSFLPEVARHNKAVETWAIASTDAFNEVTGKDEDTATAKELFAFLKDAQQQGQKLSPDNLFEVRHIMSTYGFNSLSELSAQLEKIFRKDGISQVDFNQAIKSGLYGTDDIRTLDIPRILDLMDQVQGELMVGNNFEVEPQETYDTYERPQGVLNIPQKITLREVVDRVKEQVQDFSNEQELLEAIQEVSPPAFQEKFDSNEEFRKEFLKGFEGMRRVPVQVVENGELVSLTKRQSLLRNTFPANLDITRISARFKYLQSIPELIWLNSTEELKKVLDNLENYFIEQGIDVIGLKDMSQENVLRTLNATIESAQTGNTDILADTLDSILGAEQFSKLQRFGENLKDTTLLYIDSELSQQELFEQQGLIKVKGNIYQKVSLTEPIQDIYSYIEDTPVFKQRQDKKQTVEQYVRSLDQGLPFKNDRAQAYRIVFEHEPLPKQDVSSLQTLDKERTEYLKNEYPLDFYKDILRGKKMDTLRHKFNKWTINGQDIVPMDDVIAEDMPPTIIEYAKLSRNEELRQYLPEMNDAADPVLQAINFPEQTPEHFSQYKRYGTNILTPRNSTEVIKINGELYALVGQDDMSSVYSKLVYSKQDNRYFTTEAFAQTNQDQINELLELGQRAHQSIETADELNKKTGLSSPFMQHLQEVAQRPQEQEQPRFSIAAQELSPQSNNIGSPILQQLSNQLLKLGTVTKLSFLSPKQLQDYLTEKGISVKLAQQVLAWHGSPYLIDKFSTDAIGTGEGAQAFGWGLYFTDLENIGKTYAKRVSGITYNGINLKEMQVFSKFFHPMVIPSLMDMEKTKPKSNEEALQWLENNKEGKDRQLVIDLRTRIESINIPSSERYLYKTTLFKDKAPDEYNTPLWDKGVTEEQHSLFKEAVKNNPLLKNTSNDKGAPTWREIRLEFNRRAKQAKTNLENERNNLLKEEVTTLAEKEGYKSFTDDRTGRLRYYAPSGITVFELDNKGIYGFSPRITPTGTRANVSQEMFDIATSFREKAPELERQIKDTDDFVGRKQALRLFEEETSKGGKFSKVSNQFGSLYQLTADILSIEDSNPQKTLSLFLLERGIDGIKYPAESAARGATSDTARGFNYVVFDENAITIEEVIRFQTILSEKGLKLTPQGLYNPSTREVIVNEQAVDPTNTMIHEFAHAFFHTVREKRPDVYQAGMNLVNKNKKEAQAYIDLIKQVQPELVEGTQEFNEEVLTQIIGDNGSRLVKSKIKGSLSTWLKDFWNSIKDILGLSSYTAEQISNMTIQQFSDAVLKDMFSGQDINELYQEAQEYFTREADRLPLTLSVFSRPEFTKLQGSKVKPITVLNLLNQQGIKQIEKDLIKQIIDKNYPDQKQIPYDELEATVRANIMPLERLFTSSYAGYGMDSLGNGDYGNANTIILNAPIEHGVTGHFSGDFKASSRTSIKYVPKQLNDNTWVAVDEKYTEDSNPNNIYQYVGTAGTKESVDAWIENYKKGGNRPLTKENTKLVKDGSRYILLNDKNSPIITLDKEDINFNKDDVHQSVLDNYYATYPIDINKGMFGHIRVWQDGDIFYTAELQSDYFQKNNAKKNILVKNKDYQEAQDKIKNKEREINRKEAEVETAAYQVSKEDWKNYAEDILSSGQYKISYEDSLTEDLLKDPITKVELRDISDNKLVYRGVFRRGSRYDIQNPNYDAIPKFIGEGLRLGVANNLVESARAKKIEFKTEDTQIKVLEEELNILTKQLGELRKNLVKKETEILTTLPEIEKQFIASQKEWEKRMVRETIKEASLSGATELRFPTPYTLSVIEGYVTQGQDTTMPYTVVRGDADFLVAGDMINYGGEHLIVVEMNDEEITVVAEDKVRIERTDENWNKDFTFQNEEGVINGNTVYLYYKQTDAERLSSPNQYYGDARSTNKEDFSIERDLSETQQTVARKYLEIADILKEERGSENFTTVTDENGFDWYSTKLTENDIQQPVVAFQVAPAPQIQTNAHQAFAKQMMFDSGFEMHLETEENLAEKYDTCN